MQVLHMETTGNSKMNANWQLLPTIDILMLYSQIVNIYMKDAFQNGGRLSVKKRQMSAIREHFENSYTYTKTTVKNW